MEGKTHENRRGEKMRYLLCTEKNPTEMLTAASLRNEWFRK